MRLLSATLPERVLRLMSKEDRARLGHAGVTLVEAVEVADVQAEKKLQDQIGTWLALQGITANRSRMDRRKTDRVGWPDFTFGLRDPGEDWAVACAVEVKVGTGKLTGDQEECMNQLDSEGWACLVATSLDEVIAFVRNIRGH